VAIGFLRVASPLAIVMLAINSEYSLDNSGMVEQSPWEISRIRVRMKLLPCFRRGTVGTPVEREWPDSIF